VSRRLVLRERPLVACAARRIIRHSLRLSFACFQLFLLFSILFSNLIFSPSFLPIFCPPILTRVLETSISSIEAKLVSFGQD